MDTKSYCSSTIYMKSNRFAVTVPQMARRRKIMTKCINLRKWHKNILLNLWQNAVSTILCQNSLGISLSTTAHCISWKSVVTVNNSSAFNLSRPNGFGTGPWVNFIGFHGDASLESMIIRQSFGIY